MQRERVSENVYWFQSDIYAQVCAGVVVGPQWVVLIDTLMPQESLVIREFTERKLGLPVRYIINTHHHADHSWGNSLFPGATIIGHDLCRKFLTERAPSALEVASQDNPLYRQIKILPPQITFREGTLTVQVGKKHLTLMTTPGHSDDGISVLVDEDRILFAGDAFMPIPFIVEGDLKTSISTIQSFQNLGLENIIQGHGDIILRGEIEEKIKQNITYLKSLEKAVRTAKRRKNPLEILDSIDVEACGKSRILLGGLAPDLHRRNLRALYLQAISLEKESLSESEIT